MYDSFFQAPRIQYKNLVLFLFLHYSSPSLAPWYWASSFHLINVLVLLQCPHESSFVLVSDASCGPVTTSATSSGSLSFEGLPRPPPRQHFPVSIAGHGPLEFWGLGGGGLLHKVCTLLQWDPEARGGVHNPDPLLAQVCLLALSSCVLPPHLNASPMVDFTVSSP